MTNKSELFLLIGLLSISINIYANEDLSCRFKVNHKTQKYECLDKDGLDQLKIVENNLIKEGQFPEKHKRCKGRRTLARSKGGAYLPGCAQ